MAHELLLYAERGTRFVEPSTIAVTKRMPADPSFGKIWKIWDGNLGTDGTYPVVQNLRIDPGRLVSKLLDIFNIGARIHSGIAVGAALAAQFQHT